MYAGSKRAVVSLWQIDDADTSQLMPKFYEAVLQNKSPTTALRGAQLQFWQDKNGKTLLLGCFHIARQLEVKMSLVDWHLIIRCKILVFAKVTPNKLKQLLYGVLKSRRPHGDSNCCAGCGAMVVLK